MQKTRLGISVGLLGAAIYFMGLFSGYLLAVLLAGYVLLFEENSWLRKNAVKAMSVMAVFSLLITVLNLVPNAIGFINDVVSIFGAPAPRARVPALPQAPRWLCIRPSPKARKCAPLHPASLRPLRRSGILPRPHWRCGCRRRRTTRNICRSR